MKTNLIMCIVPVLLLFHCMNPTIEKSKPYVESEPSFFGLRHGDWLTNTWIRKPENLLALHETFKKFGYTNLIDDDMLFDNPLIIQDIYINKTARNLLDSLELTYNQPDMANTYYREFWQRRKVEKNDSIVYIIIKEINFAVNHKNQSVELSSNAHSKLVNDTLINLLEIEFHKDSMTELKARQHFETLRRLGFHQSAYNLLYETGTYEGLSWDRDSLANTLKATTHYVYPWFQDTTP